MRKKTMTTAFAPGRKRPWADGAARRVVAGLLISAIATSMAHAQSGTSMAGGDWTGRRATQDEVFAIKGWKGGTTDGGTKSFTTSFSWSVVALPTGAFRYQYEFLKSRGPRLGTFGIELPAFCEADLASCVDLGSISASIPQLPAATFSMIPSWFNFAGAEADGIALTKNPFSGLELDFTDFESEGGGNGTGLATIQWSIMFDSPLAPMWGSFFASPLLTTEVEGSGGKKKGTTGHGNGEEEVAGAPVGCVIDYGVVPDPITGETEIPGPPRAYNCGAFYTGSVVNGGWVATPGTVVPEPSTYVLMVAGLIGLGVFVRRRRV